jgi:drug/metabolite transporter (DMT)-like permease
MERTRGYIAIALAATVWSTMGIFGKLAFEYGIDPVTLIALRLVFSFTALFVPLMIFRRDLIRIRREDVLFFLFLGIFLTALQRIAYFYSVDLTSPTIATLLIYLYPVYVTIYASLKIKEKVTPLTLAALILSFLGIALVVKVYDADYTSANAVGILCGLLSGLGFATYFILTKKLRSSYTNWTLILFGDGIGALVLSPVILISWAEITNYPFRLWMLIVAIAIFSSLVGYLLYSYALKYVEASKGSILSTLEPLSVAFLSAIILHERLELAQIAGMFISLSGIAMLFYKERK